MHWDIEVNWCIFVGWGGFLLKEKGTRNAAEKNKIALFWLQIRQEMSERERILAENGENKIASKTEKIGEEREDKNAMKMREREQGGKSVFEKMHKNKMIQI